MFEAAELGHKVSKEEYATREPKLREALLKAQYDLLAHAKFPVVILIGGVDGAGSSRRRTSTRPTRPTPTSSRRRSRWNLCSRRCPTIQVSRTT